MRLTWGMDASFRRQARTNSRTSLYSLDHEQSCESFFAETFTSSEGAFTAGGGVRALVGDRVTIGVDMRVGWELHLRLNGF
jgi:hypothetical protein